MFADKQELHSLMSGKVTKSGIKHIDRKVHGRAGPKVLETGMAIPHEKSR